MGHASDLEKKSFHNILKVTGLIGGTKVINVIINMAKTKILAVLLGPFGIGLEGLLLSTTNLMSTFTGLGLNFSAVREIAIANGTRNPEIVSKTILILRRWMWFTGIIGMLALIVLAKQLSFYSFGNFNYVNHIRILSITLLFGAISGGQSALLQGLRRIKDMAKSSITGVITGFIISITLYLIWGIDAIVPVILLNSLAILYRTWWYSRKVRIVKVVLSLKETFFGGISMLKLGLYKMGVGFIGKGTNYLIMVYLAKSTNIHATGFFKASWVLAAIYLNFVLDAMSKDFYPKLSAVQNNFHLINKMVNEQAVVALLLGGPIIVIMLTFTDFIIVLLYSSDFLEMSSLLSILVFATIFKLVSWPLGYVLIAKGNGPLFLISEIIWQFSFLIFFYLTFDNLGLISAGISYLIAFIVNIIFLHFTLKYLIKFKWDNNVIKHFTFFFICTIIVFFGSILLAKLNSYMLGSFFISLSLFYSYIELNKLIDIKNIL
ncbi:MAG: oligosaccharide flippase family protein, partial [Ignavibacteriae bacterium]|nr:oligosaccharide flippase family protein [Ignavibacteriota bacterium]